ncbi:hypothetical protein H2200_011835 [Cladophialophora chaetospira]|uniref:Inosine/uridine-preferring nucleoside hydrolase domain-containing protein n=1 Tax=Cladophialophora chaetospira TaxID=386627 RepID=A0AA39CCW3_9EURO|nr:hypothetical protein H2200_011835 [Cladophialophora chaetospira]
MKSPRLAFYVLTSLVFALTSAARNLIIDTDLFSDVDDAGALLLAATTPHTNLLAVAVNYPSSFSALAASAILAHYGHPSTPIGIRRPLTNATFFDNRSYELGEYTSKIAFQFSGGSLPWGHAEEAWDPVTLYRKALAEAEDGSVTIASIGFLDNVSFSPPRATYCPEDSTKATLTQLCALLNSTSDTYSTLNGHDLVSRKVSELVIMGGGYPTGRPSWNFWGSGNVSLAAHVVHTWPGRVVFAGTDVGKHVLTGGPLMMEGPKTDPVRMAYMYYSPFKARPSWDPLVVSYAMDGLRALFTFGNEYGYNQIEPDGSNRWIWDESVKTQFFLRLKVDNATAAAHVDDLFLRGARSTVKRSEGNTQPAAAHVEL